MRPVVLSLPIFAALALSACASLTAERPLFAARDDHRPAPIAEGVWVRVDESCTSTTIQTPGPLPPACMSFDLRRTADGWTILTPAPSASSAVGEPPTEAQGVIAPAVERDLEGLPAPIYVLERVERGDDGSLVIRYDGVIPIGERPAREVNLVLEVSCGEALAEGPIASVTEEFDEDGRTMLCTAHSQRAVREAVRRAAIENLPYLQNSRFILRQHGAQHMDGDALVASAATPVRSER